MAPPPDAAWSFAYILQRLSEQDLDARHLEVFNFACPGANSHVMRAIAEQCVEFVKPDWIIIYMGNNEWIGPYGSASGYGVGNPFFNKMYYIYPVIDYFFKNSVLFFKIRSNWSLKFFNYPSCPENLFSLYSLTEPMGPTWWQTVNRFDRNLKTICNLARDKKTKIALCTVGVNLRDWGPYAGPEDVAYLNIQENRSHAGNKERSYSESFSEQKNTQGIPTTTGTPDSVKDARAWFNIAESLYKQGKFDDARKAYQQARDLDWLPSGANSVINSIIRETAHAYKEKGVVLVDAEKRLNELCPHGIADSTAFYDGVHLSLAGHVAVALLLKSVLLGTPETRNDPPEDLVRVAYQLGLSAADHKKQIASLLSALPPFHQAFTHLVPPAYDRNRHRHAAELKQISDGGDTIDWSRIMDQVKTADRLRSARLIEKFLYESNPQVDQMLSCFSSRYPSLQQTGVFNFERALFHRDINGAEHWLQKLETKSFMGSYKQDLRRLRLMMAKEKHEEALLLCDDIIERWGYVPEALETKYTIASQTGDMSSALKWIDQLVRVNPKDHWTAEQWDSLTKKLYPTEANTRRATFWKKLAAQYPAVGEIAWRNALILMETGHTRDARDCFTRCAILEPEIFDPAGKEAAMLCEVIETGEDKTLPLSSSPLIDEALNSFFEAVNKLPRHRTINTLKAVIRGNPSLSMLYARLAEELSPDEAETTWREIVAETGHYRAKYQLTWVLLGKGKLEEASTLARQVYDADPRDPAMIMIYAEVAAARNEWKEVEKSCKQALSLNPDIPRAKELLQACPKPQDSDAP